MASNPLPPTAATATGATTAAAKTAAAASRNLLNRFQSVFISFKFGISDFGFPFDSPKAVEEEEEERGRGGGGRREGGGRGRPRERGMNEE